MLELFPEGFEEVARSTVVELAAYTNAEGATRVWRAFGEVSASDVPDDWAESWRRFHRPARVGPLWLGPPWERPPAGALAVVIEPGRAFGTGAHETTRLCLERLIALDRGSLLDVGCGSGVLAIAAAKLGFAPVYALDHDPPAVEATRRNAAANGVSVEVRLADAFETSLPSSDVGVANLSLAAVERLALRLSSPVLVASGYLGTERPRLGPYRAVERHVSGRWACDLCVLAS